MREDLTPQDEIETLRAECRHLRRLNRDLSAHCQSKVGDTVTEELWNAIWQALHPGAANAWEYTGQVVREVRSVVADLRAENERLRETLEEGSTRMEVLALYFEEGEARRRLDRIREPIDAAIRQCEEDAAPNPPPPEDERRSTRHHLGQWSEERRAWKCSRCGSWISEHEAKVAGIGDCSVDHDPAPNPSPSDVQSEPQEAPNS